MITSNEKSLVYQTLKAYNRIRMRIVVLLKKQYFKSLISNLKGYDIIRIVLHISLNRKKHTHKRIPSLT